MPRKFAGESNPVGWIDPVTGEKRIGHVLGGAGAVLVGLHHGGPQGTKPKEDVRADAFASMHERQPKNMVAPGPSRSCSLF